MAALAAQLSPRVLHLTQDLCLQVEGGYVFGLGMMLQEEVTYTADGQPTYDSTWNYKLPTYACIPRELNVSFLQDSPNKKGVSGRAVIPSGMLRAEDLTY